MARKGMVDFILLGKAITRVQHVLKDAQERGAEKCTVDRADLNRIVETFMNFDVQILNPRS